MISHTGISRYYPLAESTFLFFRILVGKGALFHLIDGQICLHSFRYRYGLIVKLNKTYRLLPRPLIEIIKNSLTYNEL